MTKLKSALLVLCLLAACIAPALALDRVNWYYALQPPSTWLNQSEKDSEYAIGQMIWDFLGRSNTSGFYTNLSVVPATTPMYVQVQPTNLSQLGSLYQVGVADANPFGGTGGGGPTAPAGDILPADSTQLFEQGLLSSPTASIGPLVAPTTAGFSVIDLIECQAQVVDQNPQSVNYVSSVNVASTGTADRDRVTTIVCQQKAGVAASSPTAPAVDTGWVAVGTVTLLTNASSISSGDISAATPFNGFLPAGSATTFVDLSSNQTAAGNKTWRGVSAFDNLLEFGNASVVFGNLPEIAGDWQANPGLILNVATGSAGVQIFVNGTSTGASITPAGSFVSNGSSYGPTSANIAGTETVNGGTWDGAKITSNATSAFILNAGNSGSAIAIHKNDSDPNGLKIFDGGTTNYANLLSNELTFSGASTSSYTSTDATVEGNLIMPNQAAGQCAQFDASHHLVAAGGACGLASGTITSVSSNNSNLLTSTASGSVALDYLHAPQFNSMYVNTPDAATGYNVYVGTSPGSETKQNSSPIPIGTAWTEPTSGLISGSALPTVDHAGFYANPNTPSLTSTAAGTLGATTYYVKETYVDASGESIFTSNEASLAVPANYVLNVSSANAYTPATSVADLIFGSDYNSALSRNGSAFKFQVWKGGVAPTVEADGGFISGSANYYSSYATVPGTITGHEIAANYSSAVGNTSGTQSFFATDSNGYMNLLTSGNSFLFRQGTGATEATLNASSLNVNGDGQFTGSVEGGYVSGHLPSGMTSGEGDFRTGDTSGGIWLCGNGSPYCHLDFGMSSDGGGPGTARFTFHGHVRVLSDIDTYGGAINLNPLGTVVAPTLGYTSGGSLPSTTYYVELTGVSLLGEGYSGNASAEESITVPANNVLTVTAPVMSSYSPESFNIYVTTTSGDYSHARQTTNILPGATWTEPTSGLVSGVAMPSVDNSAGWILSARFGLNLPVCTGIPANWAGPTLPYGGAYVLSNTCSSANASYNSLALATPLPITSGGTGSSTQNFVDLSTNQTIAGNKTFSNLAFFNLGVTTSGLNVTGLTASRCLGLDASKYAANSNCVTTVAASTPISVSGTSSVTVSCSTCLTTAGGQTVSSSDTFSAGLTSANVIVNTLSVNSCIGANASKQLVSNTNCLHSLTVSGPLSNSGTATDPNIACLSCLVGLSVSSSNLSVSGGTNPTVTLTSTPSFTSLTATAGLSDTGDLLIKGNGQLQGTSGENLHLEDIATTTTAPNKYIRANGSNGNLEFVNSAYNTVVSYMTDGGVWYGAGFVNTSRREFKHDIAPLPKVNAIELLRKADWVQFRYKKGDQSLHYGFIADNTPALLSMHHTGFDAERVATFEAQAILEDDSKINVLTNEVHELSARVARLESERVVDTRYKHHDVWWYLFHPNVEVGE